MTQLPKAENVLGIIAGSGRLPGLILEACRQKGQPAFVLAFEGETDPAILEDAPYAYARVGAVGSSLDALRRAGVAHIVMAGRMERPSIGELRPDMKGAKLLAKLGTSLFAGDDRLLSTIIRFFEEEGFVVLGVEEILGDILAPQGPLGRHRPDRKSQEDIALGVKVVKALGQLDIGQAAIIQNGYVLGMEAVEGTDCLIERCVALKVSEQGGVLVKAKKPGQERRADLPAIGPETVRRIAAAGFKGIAVEAGHSIILERKLTVQEANRLGVFMVGFTYREEEPQ